MALTIGDWILLAVLLVIGLVVAGLVGSSYDSPGWAITTCIATVVICVITALIISWYHKNTASGVRGYKDYESNMNNGLDRTVTITAEDGRLIYEYSGKIDIEDNENYILFEDENGKRHIIYYGKLDTVIIEEN